MKNMFFPDINAEMILNHIQKRLERKKQLSLGQTVKGDLNMSDFHEVRERLSTAQKHAAVGTKLGPMTRMKGWKRRLARVVGKIVLRLGNVISADQRFVNQSLIDSVQILCQKIEEQDRNLHQLLQKHLDELNFEKDLQEMKNEIREEMMQRFDNLLEDLRAKDLTKDDIEDFKNRMEDLQTQWQETNQLIESWAKRFAKISEENHSLKVQLRVQERRLTLLLEEARKRLPEPLDQEQVKKFGDMLEHMNDALYLSFEDIFRGSREEIKRRQRIYLPYIREAGMGKADTPVLDLGCGRGEWLELLRDEGMVAKGVDLNEAMIELSRGFGLDVQQADVLEYLAGVPDASYGVVTGFHIIEHLPFQKQLRLLGEILRVLQPGGFVILETPNPRNILVGACNFYSDPTHIKPVHPEMLKFLTEIAGFTRVEIKELNPNGDLQIPEDGSIVTSRFNELFYGPQDYAVLGWKV